MRALVIGGSGLVGSHLLRHLNEAGHTAVGTYRQRGEPELEFFDAANVDAFQKLLVACRPDVVIHAAGWTWVDGCETDPGRALEENCHQPVRLAEICHRAGIRFVYFSTSYIFDGKDGPYDESAKPNPINVYARSKWEAEKQLAEVTGHTVLLPRIICVFGEEVRRKNFACQVCDAMLSGKALVLPSDQRGNPTWAGDIARATLELISNASTGPWHLGGPNPNCSRLEWAQQLVAGFEAVGLKPKPTFGLSTQTTEFLAQKALRPLHAGVVSKRLTLPHFPNRDFSSLYQKLATGSTATLKS